MNCSPEFLQMRYFKSQSCCVLVASEPVEQRLEFSQCLVEIESGYAPSGTDRCPVFHAQDEHRPAIFLQQLGRHDPQDPPVPAGPGYNQSPLRDDLGHGGKRCFNLIQDLPLKALPFAVHPVELQGDLSGPAGITGSQSGECYFRIAQPSGGIESGRNPEGEVLGCDGGEGELCLFRNGRNPRPLGRPDLVQACLDEKPVLTKERGHVSHRSQGHQVEIVFQVRFRTGDEPPSFSKGRPQGHAQEKGQPHAGQMLERERTVGTVRIDHRAKGSEGLIHLMVIGDHHLQTEVCCEAISWLFDTPQSTVTINPGPRRAIRSTALTWSP